jgi:hypothetical protein
MNGSRDIGFDIMVAVMLVRHEKGNVKTMHVG